MVLGKVDDYLIGHLVRTKGQQSEAVDNYLLREHLSLPVPKVADRKPLAMCSCLEHLGSPRRVPIIHTPHDLIHPRVSKPEKSFGWRDLRLSEAPTKHVG